MTKNGRQTPDSPFFSKQLVWAANGRSSPQAPDSLFSRPSTGQSIFQQAIGLGRKRTFEPKLTMQTVRMKSAGRDQAPTQAPDSLFFSKQLIWAANGRSSQR
jgi:hypothetical protein